MQALNELIAGCENIYMGSGIKGLIELQSGLGYRKTKTQIEWDGMGWKIGKLQTTLY